MNQTWIGHAQRRTTLGLLSIPVALAVLAVAMWAARANVLARGPGPTR